MDLVERHVSLVRRLTDAAPETEWSCNTRPRPFSQAELEVSLQACETAIHAWGPGRSIIPQPADDGRGRHAQCLCRPDRMDVPPLAPAPWRHRLRPPAQRPWHRRRGCRAGSCRLGRIASRAASLAMASALAISTSSTSRSTSTRRAWTPAPRLLGHRRGAALRRALQPAARAPAPPPRRRPRLTSFSARTKTLSRRPCGAMRG